MTKKSTIKESTTTKKEPAKKKDVSKEKEVKKKDDEKVIKTVLTFIIKAGVDGVLAKQVKDFLKLDDMIKVRRMIRDAQKLADADGLEIGRVRKSKESNEKVYFIKKKGDK